MAHGFDERLSAIAAAGADLLFGGLKGVEKESLRVDLNGALSEKRHPVALGSALTNRFITTDFSEALLEFVTPAFPTTWEALNCLCGIHQFTYSELGNEMIWAASMPCRIPQDDGIPLARYGASNVGQMKTIYRRGLGYRYGRQMQTIAGVHFNYSLPKDFWAPYRSIVSGKGDADEFRSQQYLGMVRNIRRNGWLLLYLFGASPAICKSFLSGSVAELDSMNDETAYAPYGTSLRMSDIGYSNQNQSRIDISLNSLDGYVRDLSRAIETPEPAYEKIGVKVDGKFRQLNANLLQIENEFYSSVRPKRVAKSGERPTAALRRGGIEYVEIRSLDINLIDPCGINQNTMRFIESFLIYCLLQDSPNFGAGDIRDVNNNQSEVAKRGRDPALRLKREGRKIALQDWGDEIIDGVAAVAAEIDRHDGDSAYQDAVELMRTLVADASLTPSARIVAALEENQTGFSDYALSVSRNHRNYFASIAPPDSAAMQVFRDEATASIERQSAIEAADKISIDEYLEAYFSRD